MRIGAVRCASCGLAVLAALLAGDAAAREEPVRRTAALPDLPGATVISDAARSTGGLEFSDLTRFEQIRERDDWVFQATMRRELVDGMFTVVEGEWDCDGRRADLELLTRASAGSRFRPSAWVPQPGLPAPMDLIRSSWASPFEEKSGSPELERRTLGMTNIAPLAVPLAGGPRLRFRVPSDLAARRGARGATTPPAVRWTVRTTCSDHPVAFDYDASREPRAMTLDGVTTDWTGGSYADDPGDELHPSVAHMDVTSVWCEHDATSVWVRVDFDRPGFGRVSAGDGDVAVSDVLHVELQPRGTAYMQTVAADIPATDRAEGGADRGRWPPGLPPLPPGVPLPPGFEPPSTPPRPGAAPGSGRGTSGVTWAAGKGTVEVRIPRDPKQSKFRVVVWSDAIRSDAVVPEWLELPR